MHAVMLDVKWTWWSVISKGLRGDARTATKPVSLKRPLPIALCRCLLAPQQCGDPDRFRAVGLKFVDQIGSGKYGFMVLSPFRMKSWACARPTRVAITKHGRQAQKTHQRRDERPFAFLIEGIRSLWAEHPHSAFVSHTFILAHTSHWGSRCRTTCLHKKMFNHMSERLLFPCFVFFLCHSCLYVLSLTSPCSARQLLQCRESRASNPKRTRQMKSIARWRFSYPLAPSILTLSASSSTRQSRTSPPSDLQALPFLIRQSHVFHSFLGPSSTLTISTWRAQK